MNINQSQINVNTQNAVLANDEKITPGYALEIKTLQISAFRILIEALKEILKDATIKFTPVIYDSNGEISSASGLSIIAMNQTTSVLIRLKLPAKNFEKYYVKSKKPIFIGVNMTCLHKLIKTINNDDQMLTLFLEENDMNHLGIKIENTEKNTNTTYKLNILDSDTNELQIPSSEFEAVVTMLSSDFQRIIKDMSNICDKVNIAFADGPSNRNTLIFTGKGEFASQKTVLQAKESDKSDNSSDSDLIIHGTYDLRNLSLFSKCSNLCQNIELFMKNNYPLIIRYQIANLGHVYLVLSPKNTEDTNENSDNEDSDNDENNNDDDDDNIINDNNAELNF
jgi:proliferating cell nuclear antigen